MEKTASPFFGVKALKALKGFSGLARGLIVVMRLFVIRQRNKGAYESLSLSMSILRITAN